MTDDRRRGFIRDVIRGAAGRQVRGHQARKCNTWDGKYLRYPGRSVNDHGPTSGGVTQRGEVWRNRVSVSSVRMLGSGPGLGLV